MSRYVCADCGAVFDEPRIVTEKHGFDRPPYEQMAVCPECNSSSFEEVVNIITEEKDNGI